MENVAAIWERKSSGQKLTSFTCDFFKDAVSNSEYGLQRRMIRLVNNETEKKGKPLLSNLR
jgi:hypothetical protein